MSRRLRGWRLILMARCEDASRASSDAWDGPVDRDRRWAAALHRFGCAPCRLEHRRLSWLRGLLASAPEAIRRQQVDAGTAALTPEAARRIRSLLAAERDGDHGPDGPEFLSESL